MPHSHGYRIWFGIFVGLSAFYALVFALTETLVLPRDIALWAICNALPHIAFAVPLVDRWAPRLPDLRGADRIGAICDCRHDLRTSPPIAPRSFCSRQRAG